MQIADDESMTWSSSSSRILKFAGLGGIRPLLLVALALLCLPLSTVACGAVVASYATVVAFFHLVLHGRYFAKFARRLTASTAVEGSPSGTFLVPRLSLLIAATAVWPPEDAGNLLLLSACVLVVSLDATARSLEQRALPVAVNLPGFTFPTSPRVPSALIFAGSIAAIAAYTWHLGFGVHESVPWVFSALALGLGLFCTADSAYLILRRQRISGSLNMALRDLAPAFVLHWQAPANTTYQVEMWLPYLDLSNLNYFVLARSTTNFSELQKITTRPIVLLENLGQLDAAIVPSLRAALYVNTATVNSHLVRYAELNHIQLNHGDSDKSPSYNPVLRMFTRNFVAGQAAVDRFACHDVPTQDGFFEIVGRPQIAGLHRENKLIGEIANKSVLYAPTWRGFYDDTNYSSLSFGKQIVTALVERGCTVLFRPHPYSQKSETDLRLIAEIDSYLAGDSGTHKLSASTMSTPILHLFDSADALISDISSVVSDFLYTEKPYAVAAKLPADEIRTALPAIDGGYLIDISQGHPTALGAVLDQLLSTDPHREHRRSIKRYYLGDIPDDQRVDHFLAVLSKYTS